MVRSFRNMRTSSDDVKFTSCRVVREIDVSYASGAHSRGQDFSSGIQLEELGR